MVSNITWYQDGQLKETLETQEDNSTWSNPEFHRRKKQDVYLATKTKRDGFQFIKPSSCMEEVETKHGVLPDWYD